MALLAQQELMESPPARRLIVPHPHTAHYGVDPGTQRVAVACALDGAQGLVYTARTASFAPMEGGARLSAIYADTLAFVTGLLADSWWPKPGLVMVEQPSGRQPNPPLSYATGVIMAAVFDAVVDVTGHRVRVETCSSSWWKKRACGNGAIYKPKSARAEYGVMAWCRANGMDPGGWDEADALGIAEAARREVALEQR